MLPPTEKSAIPLARLRPLAYAANFEPSGWYAAVPRPDRPTKRSTTPYVGDAAAAAIGEVEAQTLAFAVADPPEELPPPAKELDAILGGRLARLAAAGDLRSDAWSVCVVHPDNELRAERIAASGIGKPSSLDADA